MLHTLSRGAESRLSVREAPEEPAEARRSSQPGADAPAKPTDSEQSLIAEDRFAEIQLQPASVEEPSAGKAVPGAPSPVGENEGPEFPTTVPPQGAAEQSARAAELDEGRQEKVAAEAYRVAPPDVVAAPDQARADQREFQRTADPDKQAQPVTALQPSREAINVGGIETAALRDRVEEDVETRFFAVQPEDAAVWLGGALRTLPEFDLQRVEVGPGSAIEGGLAGLPAVKLIYEDAAGSQLVLIQQLLGDSLARQLEEPGLRIGPAGVSSFLWHDPRGYRLILQGSISGDSLRALADRVR